MKISVIMSCYNINVGMFKTAVHSILQQTFRDFELIIVNDGMSDEKEELLGMFSDSRVKWIINERNKGLAYSLNRAIRAAEGKYIVRMDTDDIALKNRLRMQYEYMENRPTCTVCATRYLFLQDGKVSKGDDFFGKGIEIVNASLFMNCYVQHPTVMIRRDFLIKHNVFYNEKLYRGQDYALWADIVLHGGSIDIIKDVLLIYRIHKGQASVVHRQEQREVQKMVREKFLNALGVQYSCEEFSLHERLSELEGKRSDWKNANIWYKKIVETDKGNYKDVQALKGLLVKYYVRNFPLKRISFVDRWVKWKYIWMIVYRKVIGRISLIFEMIKNRKEIKCLLQKESLSDN